MRRLFSILAVLFLFVGINEIYSQAQIDIPITVSNDATVPSTTEMFVGLDQTATAGLDPSLGEANLPPLPPAGVWDARFTLGAQASLRDYRNAPSFPFTGSITHNLTWQQQTGGSSVTINYNVPVNATITIQDVFGGVVFDSGSLTGTGSYTITASATAANIIMTYSGILPAGPGFEVSPVSPLTIAPTAIGSSNNANVTVTNTGTAALEISGITSSNPEFTFAPNTFPVSIAVGGNQVFVVTFTPASLGNKTSNLVFTHNAGGSPTTYVVNGVGADAGPTFAVSPVSLNFGSAIPGNSANQNVTVNNNGLTNALVISSVTVPVGYSVNPTSANIAAGGSQIFTVTFAPTAGGSYNGNLTFTHNAVGSPSVVTLSGSGATLSGLIFKNVQQTRREADSYTDTLTLRNLDLTATGPIQALQFKLLINAPSSEDTVVRFNNITKGSDVSGANWLLEYNIERGAATVGASVDTVYGLLYNINPTGGLANLDYYDLLRINYQVVDLPANKDSAMSVIKIMSASASNGTGLPVSITPLPDSLQINVWNRVSRNSLGDVNGDGFIDILDLIYVVDHIVSRDSLSKDIALGLATSEFFRANIAPWGSPDAVVNVQDLVVIQNIILTGQYPNGNPIYKPAINPGNQSYALNKSNTVATVKFYITEEGIAVRLVSEVGIRGAQLEFGSVADNTSNMIIDSKLGGGFYTQINDLLRVLLYDQAGNSVIESGDNFVANIPFTLVKPKDISVDKIILVDVMNNKVGTINVEIFYNNAPEIPVDYSLSQNFPNPFNPTTTVKFSVPKDGAVTLKVYDMLGQEVVTLFFGNTQRGTYTLNWNGKDGSGKYVSSGSYIYRMSANNGEFVQSKKMIFLK